MLEAEDLDDLLERMEGFFQLEPPSTICPRWVSRINMEVNQEALKQQMGYLEKQLKSQPEKNHVDLDRIKELRQELLVDPQQPWNFAKNNFTFRSRGNYCLSCTLRDRFLNFHPSKFSAMEQEPQSTSMTEIDKFYKERTFELMDRSRQIIGSEELVADNGRKVVFSMVTEDILYSLVAFSLMLTKGNVHLVGSCSGKRFFVYEDISEDTSEEASANTTSEEASVNTTSEEVSEDTTSEDTDHNDETSTGFSKNFTVLHTHPDAFTGRAIVVIRSRRGTVFIFASPLEYPELYDIEITELFSSIIYDYVVNGVKQEFNDPVYKKMFSFLR